MKKTLITLCIIPLGACAQEHSQESVTDLRISPLVQLEYSGPSHITTSIDQRRLTTPVVPRDQYAKIKEHTNEFVQLVEQSKLLSDIVVKYQQHLCRPKAPWENEDEKIRKKVQAECENLQVNFNTAQTTIAHLEDLDKTKKFPASDYYHDADAADWENLCGLKETIELQKRTVKELMTAQCVNALVTLQHLNAKQSHVDQRLAELLQKHKDDQP